MLSKAELRFPEINHYVHHNYWYKVGKLYAQYFDAFQEALQNYVVCLYSSGWFSYQVSSVKCESVTNRMENNFYFYLLLIKVIVL